MLFGSGDRRLLFESSKHNLIDALVICTKPIFNGSKIEL
jgi:hypothetical protein